MRLPISLAILPLCVGKGYSQVLFICYLVSLMQPSGCSFLPRAGMLVSLVLLTPSPHPVSCVTSPVLEVDYSHSFFKTTACSLATCPY